MRALPIAALLLILVAPEGMAARLAKGSHVIWVGLNGNDAQLVGPTAAGSSYEGGEIGFHVAYSQFLSDAWTVIVSGGADFGNDTFDPKGAGAKEKVTSRSWNARLGFDRYAFVNDDVALYAGPGVLYWRGHGKGEGFSDPTLDGNWPDVSQVGLNGRLGMYARLSAHYALFGHIGQVLAFNSADDSAGKRTFWTNHHEGSVGLVFDR